MSNRRRRGLVAAMEELDVTQISEVPVNSTEEVVDPEVNEPQPDQPETEPIAFSDAAESPEAQEIEVKEAEDEMVSVEEQIDEALDVIDQIEKVSDIVDRSAENGGLDQTGAELLTATLEGLYDRIGFDLGDKKIAPSLEEFGSVTQRIRSTNVSVEAIQINLKAIWEQVLKALRVLWENTKKFIAEVFNQVERFKAKSAKLREIAGKVPDAVKVQSFQDAKIANALAMDREISKNLSSDIQKVTQLNGKIFTYAENLSSGPGKKLIDLIKMADKVPGEKFVESVKNISAEMSEKGQYLNHSGIFSGGLQGDTIYGENLLGNKKFGCKFKGGGENGIATAKYILEGGESEVNDHVVPLNKNQAMDVLDAIDSLITSIEAFKKNAAKLDSISKEVLQGVQAIKGREESKDEYNETYMKQFLSGMPNIVSFFTQLPVLATKYSRTVVAASLAYVERSLKAHVGQTDEEKNNNRIPAPEAA